MRYQDFLNQQMIAQQNEQEEERKALAAYKALVQKQPTAGFFEKERSFVDALKDPTASQRDFFTNFGLALAASDSTNSLSSRIAGALGVGKKAMDTRREKELTREQALARLDLETFKTSRANRASNISMRSKIEEAKDAEDIRNIRNRKEQQSAARGYLSVDQSQENQSILGDRKFIDGLQDVKIELKDGSEIDILSPEAIAVMRQARVLAEKESPGDLNVMTQSIRDALTDRLGAKTIPNVLYNKEFVNRLDNSAKNLNSATGAPDENREKYATIATGLGGKIETRNKRNEYLNSDVGKKEFEALKKEALKAAKQLGQQLPTDEEIKQILIQKKGL